MTGLRRLARRARAAIHHTTPAERGRAVPGREHGYCCHGGTR